MSTTRTRTAHIRASITRAARRGDDLAAAARDIAADDRALWGEAGKADRGDMSAADQIFAADLARHPETDGWHALI